MPPAAFSPLGRAHVLLVRSARPSGCGLAFGMTQDRTGHAFLNTPLFAHAGFCHSYSNEKAKYEKYSTVPFTIVQNQVWG